MVGIARARTLVKLTAVVPAISHPAPQPQRSCFMNRSAVALFVCFILFSGCVAPAGSNAGDHYWQEKATLEKATQEDTVASYDAFIAHNPNSTWLEVATFRRDRAALEEAKRQNTIEAFRAFIAKYPSSVFVEKAQYFVRYGYTPVG